MVQPEQEGGLPEPEGVESGVACRGSGGLYAFRFRFWRGGEEDGSADFLELPLPEDPLEAEEGLKLSGTPSFLEVRAAAGEVSPDRKELLASVVPLLGSVVRACTLKNHRDYAITGSQQMAPRYERVVSWAFAGPSNNVKSLRPQALRLGNNGFGMAWDGDEEIRVAAGEVTAEEWLYTMDPLNEERYVRLIQSLMSRMWLVINPLLPSAREAMAQADGGPDTVEQLVMQLRGAEHLSATKEEGGQILANGVK